MHLTSSKNSKTGFTLIETVISIGILSITLCGVVAAFISCSTLVSTSKHINIATNAAMGIMEEIRTSSFAELYGDYHGLNFISSEIPENRGIVYIDDTNTELLKVTVSVCWRQGNRVIGEDLNLNGTLESGEDINNNGIIDSTVQLVTVIANR